MVYHKITGGEKLEYTINRLAKLAGVTIRTLRYYDQLDLLSPARINSSGYRIYGQKEVDRLQQILFYRELDMPLDEIKTILSADSFNGHAALKNHLKALLAKQQQLSRLIANVEKSIAEMKGETEMSNQEKFDGFTRKLVEENERQYGKEVREKYGDASIDRSNAKVMGMTKEQYDNAQRLSDEIKETLKAAFELGDPKGPLAQKACDLHKQWLCIFWDTYSKEAHIGVTQMYVEDPRFTAYYDAIKEGCAQFLRDAVAHYCR